jgi:hypothetical protein
VCRDSSAVEEVSGSRLSASSSAAVYSPPPPPLSLLHLCLLWSVISSLFTGNPRRPDQEHAQSSPHLVTVCSHAFALLPSLYLCVVAVLTESAASLRRQTSTAAPGSHTDLKSSTNLNTNTDLNSSTTQSSSQKKQEEHSLQYFLSAQVCVCVGVVFCLRLGSIIIKMIIVNEDLATVCRRGSPGNSHRTTSCYLFLA